MPEVNATTVVMLLTFYAALFVIIRVVQPSIPPEERKTAVSAG